MRPASNSDLLRSGFTLVELSIVLTIIALVSAMGLAMGSSVIESAKIASTNQKLDTIEAALMAYRVGYNRIPCPTDPTMTITSDPTHFGYEAANSGTCTGGTPAVSTSYTSKGNTTVEGAVPFKTLGLPEEYMFDGWGRKISYAVWTGITGVGAFTSYGVSTNCGTITVNNAGGTARTTAADYALISYGPDGHGGYLAGGTRYNAGSTNTDEKANAHYNNLGADTGYLAAYVQKDWTQNPAVNTDIFDDLVRYKERWQMMTVADQWSPNGTSMCVPGFRADGTVNSISGFAMAVGDIDGDGIPDLIISSAASNGSVYVIYGKNSGAYSNPMALSSAGFVLKNTAGNYGEQAGTSLAVGDVNGDGIQDIIIGNLDGLVSGKTDAGKVYVVFGQSRATWAAHASYTLDNVAGTNGLMDGTHGFEMDGVNAYDNAGVSVAAGRVLGSSNGGKPISDIIIGAEGEYGHYGPGKTYVVFGGTGSWPATFSLSALNGSTGINGTAGVEFDGVGATEASGEFVAAGDINGDGYADIITTSLQNNSPVYVIMGGSGSWTSPIALSGLAGYNPGSPGANGVNGFTLTGSRGGGSGVFLATGDVNGDGKADIIIGAEYGYYSTGNSGVVHVVFGGSGIWNSTYFDCNRFKKSPGKPDAGEDHLETPVQFCPDVHRPASGASRLRLSRLEFAGSTNSDVNHCAVIL